MNFLTDRRGAFSWFRFSILIGAIGAIFLGFGFVSFQLDQQSRRSPFFPPLPNGAQQWGVPDVMGSTTQKVFYRVVGGDAEAIATFYNEEMRKFYGINDSQNTGSSLEQCLRKPTSGQFTNDPSVQNNPQSGLVYNETYVPGLSTPFSYDCVFDRSSFNVAQSTMVTFYPGLPNANPDLSSEGSIVIVYEQRWAR
jgi:hypothetical protein